MTYHYLSMARSNYNDHIADKPEILLKKYLYVMRPLLCIRWIERHACPPPTSVRETLSGIELDSGVSSQLSSLMERKAQTAELGAEAPNDVLNDFIVSDIADKLARYNVTPLKKVAS